MFDQGYRVELYDGDELRMAIIAQPIGDDSSAAVGIYFDDPESLATLLEIMKHATQSLTFTAWKKERGATFEFHDVSEEENEDADELPDIPF